MLKHIKINDNKIHKRRRERNIYFLMHVSLSLSLIIVSRRIYFFGNEYKFNSIEINQRPYLSSVFDTFDERRMKEPLVQLSRSEKYQTAFIRSHVNNFRAACR